MVNKVYAEADCLYTEEEVTQTIDRLATEIQAKLADSDPLVLCVMTGAIIPAGRLLTRLAFPLQIDYIHATRYAGGTRGGELTWQTKPNFPLQDRVVLIIDDILDAGITLDAIMKFCRDAGAKAVYSAVLVNKIHDRKSGCVADFVGLDIEDRYVFGCGMDYNGYLRNIAGIYAVRGL